MAFQKGQSGNPAGRPKGSIDWRSVFTLESLEDIKVRAKNILLKIADAAEDGDRWAMKVIVDLMFVKPAANTSLSVQEEESEIPTINLSSDDLKALAAILEGKKGGG